jgi:ribosomal protein S18 acetylase RimI-like enzyme
VITCEDWRGAASETLEPLYRFERARWLTRLHWDNHDTQQLLEHARAAGHAPGLLARDEAGHPVGWAYYLLHHRMLQIGGLVARGGEATRALLDNILHSPEAEMANELLCFAFPSSTALESALTRRRFSVRKYLYLCRPLPVVEVSTPLRSGLRIAHWQESDAPDTVRLMSRAYAGVGSSRCFAPRGLLEEWASYLAQLIKMPACGRFLPHASLAATLPGDITPCGVLLATTLQPQTAHIAQIVVDPGRRRHGLASDLVETSCALATASGYQRMTLLVAEDNAPARALYAAAGFEPISHFVYATRGASTRMRGERPRRVEAGPSLGLRARSKAQSPLLVSRDVACVRERADRRNVHDDDVRHRSVHR